MSRLVEQLRILRAELAVDPAQPVLRVRIAAGERQLRRLARAADVEPLPRLLAQLGAGEISADVAGAAISRDLGVAAQVAQALSLPGAQTGDVTVGTVAAGNVYQIYYGGPRDERR